MPAMRFSTKAETESTTVVAARVWQPLAAGAGASVERAKFCRRRVTRMEINVAASSDSTSAVHHSEMAAPPLVAATPSAAQ